MKKKVLSLLLAVCLIVGMLPLAASAAEGDAFKVGEATFSTLKDALTEADSQSKPVEVVGTYTVQPDDGTALQSATANIDVTPTGNIKVDLTSGTGLFSIPAQLPCRLGASWNCPL